MTLYDLILAASANTFLEVLGRCQCENCGGTGERNDAEAGDMYHRSWVCVPCDGNGWNKQAVHEFIENAQPHSEEATK